MQILIIDEVHPILMDELEKCNHQVKYLPGISYEETFSIIQNYEGLVVRSGFFIDDKLIEQGVKLKFLARAGVGLDIFDLKAAEKNNIEIINAAGANANSVAEHLIGMMLSLFHNLNKSAFEVENFVWNREENRGEEIFGKTIGLLGYGNTGKAVARKLKHFDCEVLAYDRFLENYSDEYATEASMEEVFEKSDVISLHIPLTSETNKMCDDEFFNSFKKDIYFFNTSRGKIVETEILLKFLESGKILGCALDVLENENFKDLSKGLQNTFSKLFNRKNVIITPHAAGWSYRSYEKISIDLYQKIKLITT